MFGSPKDVKFLFDFVYIPPPLDPTVDCKKIKSEAFFAQFGLVVCYKHCFRFPCLGDLVQPIRSARNDHQTNCLKFCNSSGGFYCPLLVTLSSIILGRFYYTVLADIRRRYNPASFLVLAVILFTHNSSSFHPQNKTKKKKVTKCPLFQGVFFSRGGTSDEEQQKNVEGS